MLESSGSSHDARLYVGQVNPPLLYVFPNGEDLFEKSDEFNFYFDMTDPSGTLIIDSHSASFDETEDGKFAFFYEWEIGDLMTAGVHRGQFRAERKTDNMRIYGERLRLPVKATV